MSKQIIQCTVCARKLSVPAEAAGKRFRCRTCRQILSVPGPPTKTQIGGQSRELLVGLDQKIPRVRSSFGYRLALLSGAGLVALLPLIYLGLVVAAAVGVAWWATAGLGVFNAPIRGRAAILLVAAYVGPLFIGCLLVVFMIKPLFFRQARTDRGRSLTREGEPLLFEFVDKLCAAVHAPTPRRIGIDCQVNASAQFRRGLLSFVGGDLVLTIGMPLAAGLSARQLAGVLAHEFGHFSQSAGMRATYLIMSINRWFHRVVYGRDTMDQWLDDAAEGAEHLVLVLVLQLARLMIWLSRRVLWLLMIIGHACSCVLLRQMEFDADLHETRLSGSATFASTSRELQRLGYAYNEALNRAGRAHRDGQLPDDLPALARYERKRTKPDVIAEIDKQAQLTRTGFFDTHPCHAQRIARAESEGAAGIYAVEAPASDLFQHFAAICQGVTSDFYRDTFGIVPDAKKIVAVERLAQQQSVEDAAHGALQRLFGSTTSIPWNLHLPSRVPAAFTTVREIVEALRAAKQSMLELRESYRTAFSRYDELDTRWLKCSQVAALRSAGVQLDRGEFDVPGQHVRRGTTRSTAHRIENGELRAKVGADVRCLCTACYGGSTNR